MEVVTTWRTARPIDRDCVVLQIIRYEWDEDTRRSYVLALEPEPHWVEFGDGYVIMSTLEFTGQDMIYLFGRGNRHWPDNFDPRELLEKTIDERVREAVDAVMDLHPAIEIKEPG